MEKSPKSPKSPRKQVATYIINAHGTILSSQFGDSDSALITRKYHAINIPKNVELYTFANLGNCISSYDEEAEFLCDIYPEKYKSRLRKSINPAFKFSHQHGKTNKFPELFLTPEQESPVEFYSGILHCIPEALRTPGSPGKEIIYNMDAKNTKNCECSSILLKEQAEAYDCDTKYSNYYKEQLRGYKYNPAINTNINSCGPILMSEAVKVIQTHCNTYYNSNCVIQIYVIACLAEQNLHTLVRGIRDAYRNAEQRIKHGETKLVSTIETIPQFCLAKNSPQFCVAEKPPTQVSSDTTALNRLIGTIVKPRPNSIEPISVELIKDDLLLSLLGTSSEKDAKEKQKDINTKEHYYEAMTHNTFAKVDKQNVVESLNDFKATPLTNPLYDTHIFMYNAKVFKIKTFKGAYMEFSQAYHDKVSGTFEERSKKLEEKYRTLTKNKLHNHVQQALDKFRIKYDYTDDDLYSDKGVITPTPNELDILPKTNEINLALPFNITTTSEYLPTNIGEIIYTQLLKLIALEKAKKLGQGRRVKKTLRKRRKPPYANKKSKRRTN
uniref:Uncharacterized protein n=1 Tax=viral metagenome TaxID=1070528 RepID=A0A6C0D5L3_9ZZZZ